MIVMDGLVEFLTARLDEREEAANWASTSVAANEQWRLLKRTTVVLGPSLALEVSERAVAHIKLNDPAFVLADIAAKRRLADLHKGVPVGDGLVLCGTCGSGEVYEYPTRWPCETVKLLVQPFSGHRDYRHEWQPS